jgi:hypothetical protein
VAEVIAAHPDEWARYVEGDDKLTGFFTGAVMKATSGKANGKEVAAERSRPEGPTSARRLGGQLHLAGVEGQAMAAMKRSAFPSK